MIISDLLYSRLNNKAAYTISSFMIFLPFQFPLFVPLLFYYFIFRLIFWNIIIELIKQISKVRVQFKLIFINKIRQHRFIFSPHFLTLLIYFPYLHDPQAITLLYIQGNKMFIFKCEFPILVQKLFDRDIEPT